MHHSLFAWKHFALVSRIVLLLAVLAGLAYQQHSDGRLHILFPALKGDAIILQLPNGEFVLIDGGAEPAMLSAALGRAMPYWQHDLALVILTSKDTRHLPGQVAALGRYHVRQALALPEAMQGSGATLREWHRLLASQAVAVQPLHNEQRLILGGGVILRVLVAGEGCVLRIEYGKTAALLAHAIPAEEHDYSAAGRAQLVVFPWQYNPHTALIESAQAQTIVYSDGAQADEPVRLSMHDRRIGKAAQYHEALSGAIEWVSDGRRVLVQAER